ncbi:hypothetical protein [Vitiosangium sp. GDMCC 1.1324]|uniref:hypothetical protein n=1 Tax=Vitiosangium sp. (strain GDMCC 1.1324) TaxID=2138576 RepID=UPI000D3D03F8|nr:hypothetical protein [Vitiosangium sp. GDMCC 1.1324]PTL77024.1 hypothetical protein DAT35_46100 [Vitiosangium sp. GDMCC 1.1324]
MSHPEKLPLKEFREAFETRLAACSADELSVLLRVLASRVRPSERLSFLQSLQEPSDSGAQALLGQHELLDDIAELSHSLPEMAREWEELWPEEDILGPYAKLLEPLTALFSHAQEASERGQYPLAREAYHALFELLTYEDEFGRGLRPEHLSQVDFPEARARYLRAVYLTTPPEQRAPVLLEQMRRVRSLLPRGPRPLMQDWLDISSEPLPDSDVFLRDWVSLLREQDGPDADAWLREAIRLSQGTRGLRELAFSEPSRHPRAFVELLAALEREGPPRKVLTTAREALEVLPSGLPLRAAIADFLVSAAARLGQADTVRSARWEAFVSRPTLSRMLDLRDSRSSASERSRVMREAARHLEEVLQKPRRPSGSMAVLLDDEDRLEAPAHVDRRLLAHAWLLALDWESAHAIAAKESPLGWTYGDNPQGTVVPAFLVLLSRQPLGALPRNVDRLWHQALESGAHAGDWYSGDERHDAVLRDRLSRAYADVLPAFSLEPSEHERMLEWSLEIARKRVSSIVSNKHRRSYGKAATLLVASAEVLWLQGEQARGNLLLAGFRESFRRHRAFQAELDEAVGSRAPSSRH